MTEREPKVNLLPQAEVPTAGSVEFGVEGESLEGDHSVDNQSEAPAQSSPTMAPYRARGQQEEPDVQAITLKKVEDILSDGLLDVYIALPEHRRKTFKEQGEIVAQHITQMVLRGTAKVKEVWKLIQSWLLHLPGINKYFIEQEIKIKTDRVMALVAAS